MATNGQLLERFLTGRKLIESEIQQLKRAIDDYDRSTQTVLGWQTGTGQPAQMTFTDARFINSPSKATTFTRPTDTSVVNNTLTYITWEAAYGVGFSLDSSDATRIRADWGGQVILITGAPTWAVNATGYRATQIELYNGSGVLVTAHTLHVSPGVGTDDTKPCFIVILNSFIFPGLAYIKTSVRQTSGGNLVLKDMFMTMAIL